MHLEFLGVGSFFAKKHYHNNLLISDHILIDCGFTASRSLNATHRTFAQIDHIFITHTHADHIGGLEECAFFNKFVNGGTKPTLHLPTALVNVIWDESLKGGLEDASTNSTTLDDYFNVVEERDCFEIDGIKFQMVPTHHVPGKFCCGLRIDDRVYFSGDTQFDAERVSSNGSDVETIYHDCQFFTGGIHASIDELCTLPDNLRQKTCLMHLPDNYVDHVDQAHEAGFTMAEQHRVYTFE